MSLFHILTFKSWKVYFLTPFGWVFLVFVTIMRGVSLSTAMKGFQDTPVKDGRVNVTFHTPLFWFYFLFIFPLITMRLLAEEEQPADTCSKVTHQELTHFSPPSSPTQWLFQGSPAESKLLVTI